MAKSLYCWRCRMDLPMVDEEEWAALGPLLDVNITSLQDYRRAHGVGLKEAMEKGFGRKALDFYFELTGFRETNVNALWHHRISLYGPPCETCGKPLRTPRASFCAACGAEAPIEPE